MSKELTEKWKNGMLKTGDYYITTTCLGIDDVIIGFYDSELNQFYGLGDFCIKEVLSLVPTYDQFSKMVKENLDKKGTWYTERSYKLLQKKLEIATKALKNAHKFPHTMSLKEYCEQALKEMEEV